MPAKPQKSTTSNHEAIAARAFEIYLGDERHGDHALDHWLRAEQEWKRSHANSRTQRIQRKAQPAELYSMQQPGSKATSPQEAWCSSVNVPEDPYTRRR